jgi:hypothetical protein
MVGGFFIETAKAVILKRATPPVASFRSRRTASDAARRMGFKVVPRGKERW